MYAFQGLNGGLAPTTWGKQANIAHGHSLRVDAAALSFDGR